MNQKGIMRIIILLSVFCFLITIPAVAEYYQYEDAQGNLRFTDDSASIPKDTQKDITTYESIQSKSFQDPSEADVQISPTDTGGDNQLADREALEQMRAALAQTATTLKIEHEQLADQDPGLKASKLQRDEYTEKVKLLNEKMVDYKQQHQAYNNKVKAYNARISNQGSQEEEKTETGNDE